MKQHVNILGIETSCDETAAAVVQDGHRVLANVVSSQMNIHRRFGGVVPEVASRQHVEHITLVIEKALAESGLQIEDMQAIAVTKGPGLVGALLIGVAAAKAVAFSKSLPLIGVHHIAGHIYANRLVEDMLFPALALVVSGGHTQLIHMEEHGHFEIIGDTRDDAAGEAYDKVARTLGLGYPGGPEIDRLAETGTASIDFPRARLEQQSFDFSFSGLKSAVLNYVHHLSQKNESIPVADVAASFQESVVDVLVEKTIRAAQQYDVKQVLLAGGVAANRALRRRLQQCCADHGLALVIPPLWLCTDNAAMIAAAGHVYYGLGQVAGMDLNAKPNLELTSIRCSV